MAVKQATVLYLYLFIVFSVNASENNLFKKETKYQEISHLLAKKEYIRFQDSENVLIYPALPNKTFHLKHISVTGQKTEGTIETDMLNIEDLWVLPEKNIAAVIPDGFKEEDGVYFFNLKTGKKIKKLSLKYAYQFLGSSENNRLLVCTTDSELVKFIDHDSLEFVDEIPLEGAIVTTHARDHKLLAAGFNKPYITVVQDYDSSNRKKLDFPRAAHEKKDCVQAICIDPTGSYVAALNNRELCVWDLKTKQCILTHYAYGDYRSFLFTGKDSLMYNLGEFLDIKTCAVKIDPEFNGILQSSNGKGLVVFRKLGPDNTWFLADSKVT